MTKSIRIYLTIVTVETGCPALHDAHQREYGILKTINIFLLLFTDIYSALIKFQHRMYTLVCRNGIIQRSRNAVYKNRIQHKFLVRDSHELREMGGLLHLIMH